MWKERKKERKNTLEKIKQTFVGKKKTFTCMNSVKKCKKLFINLTTKVFLELHMITHGTLLMMILVLLDCEQSQE